MNTKLSISVAGKTLAGCMAFELEQVMHGHHRFSASFSAKDIEKDPQGLGTNAIDMVGKDIRVEILNDKDHGSLFTGIVTGMHSSGRNQAGNTQQIVLEGFSPTILLESAPSCQAFTELNLSDIFQKVTNHVPQNLLSPVIKPMFKDNLAYTVQYYESAFSFLNRLACRYGEWFYFDGTELVLGSKKQPETDLYYGIDLQGFDYSLSSANVHRQFIGRSYKDDTSETADSTTLSTNNSGNTGIAMNVSGKTWKNVPPSYPQMFDPENALKSQMDAVAQISLDSAAANRIWLSGSAFNPSLHPGSVVNVKVPGASGREFGKYIVVEVSHQYTIGGNYQSVFKAIPSENLVTPWANPTLIPYAPAQPGIIADNNDPDGLGRVKVQMNWTPDTTTPWIRVAMPYSGTDKGIYFVPETGEEVMVGFEGNNAERPFVMGTLFNGKMKPESFSGDGNCIKAIRTRSGHTIEFNDTDGEEMITIFDKEKNILCFNTAEKSISISALENIEIKGKNIKLVADENIELGATKNINLLADEAVGLQSGKDTTIKATGKAIIEATKDTSLSGQNVIAEGKVKAELNGAQTKVTGSAMAEVSGGVVKVN